MARKPQNLYYLIIIFSFMIEIIISQQISQKQYLLIFRSRPSLNLLNKLRSKYSNVGKLITFSENLYVLPGNFDMEFINNNDDNNDPSSQPGRDNDKKPWLIVEDHVVKIHNDFDDKSYRYYNRNRYQVVDHEENKASAQFLKNNQRKIYVQTGIDSWGLDRIDQRNLPLTKNYSCILSGGEGIDIYVIDTGIDINNPEFEGRARWGKNTISESPDKDENGHGTFVAGIIGSKTYGVAKRVNLVAVKSLDAQGIGSLSDVLYGLEYVLRAHQSKNNRTPTITNLSLGTEYSRALNIVINNIVNQGIVMVVGKVAAGNGNKYGIGIDACNTSPASASSVITVGATDINDHIANFSNYGRCVDLFAPGDFVSSVTLPLDKDFLRSGTSFSTPYVTGVIALLIDYFEDAGSKLTPDLIKRNLKILATKNVIGGLGRTNSPDLLAYSQVQELRSHGGNSVGMIWCGSGSKSWFLFNLISRYILIELVSSPSSLIRSHVRSSFETTQITGCLIMLVIPIYGMINESCVELLTNSLKLTTGIANVNVNLENKDAMIAYDPSKISKSRLYSLSGIHDVLVSPQDSNVRIDFDEKIISINEIIEQLHKTDETINFSEETLSLCDDNICPGISEIFQLQINGMNCPSCVNAIEKLLKSIKGVISIKISLLSENALIDYDPMIVSPEIIIQSIDEIGFEATIIPKNRKDLLEIKIFGIQAELAIEVLENELKKISSITDVEIDHNTKIAKIHFDSQYIGVRDICELIEGFGFKTLVPNTMKLQKLDFLSRKKETLEWRNAFYFSLALSIPIFLNCTILPDFDWGSKIVNMEVLRGIYSGNLASLMLAIPVQFGVGKRFYVSAYKALKHKNFNMDVLVTISITISFWYSCFTMLYSIYNPLTYKPSVFFDTSSMLITFVTLGRYLESLAKSKTVTTLSKLLSFTPEFTTLVTKCIRTKETKELSCEYVEKTISTELIQLGDILRIKPNDKIPADGIIITGKSTVDESMVTGESYPTRKEKNDLVLCGTLNGLGIFEMKVTRVGNNCTLSQIIKLIEEAQITKAPIQNFVDKLSVFIIPLMIVLGILTFLVWIILANTLPEAQLPKLFSSEHSYFMTSLKLSISVIIVACPCSLSLIAPTAVMVGTGIGVENGILIKGGANSIEVGYKVNKVVFTKTGILTKGQFEVKNFEIFTNDLNIELFFTLVRFAESAASSSSDHPLGKALVKYSEQLLFNRDNINDGDVVISNYEYHNELGLSCDISFTQTSTSYNVAIGNLKFLTQLEQIQIPDSIISTKEREETLGHTSILVSINKSFSGIIFLSDKLKHEAKLVIHALHDMGISVIMVTGDQQSTAQAIGNQCGIDEIYSNLTLKEKTKIIQQLQFNQGFQSVVAVVGDNRFEDSPLLAISDLMASIDLMRIVFNRIRLNFIWSMMYNVLCIPLAMGIFLPFGGYYLHPMTSGFIMALSSVCVICSSLLLKFWSKPVWIEVNNGVKKISNNSCDLFSIVYDFIKQGPLKSRTYGDYRKLNSNSRDEEIDYC
ncbi:745_t:CDS:10 [Entrophospora sp. SA101]|nr:745_t:CDS:10 [Entrophospora sp. SA101]